jgi:hypothetical protein
MCAAHSRLACRASKDVIASRLVDVLKREFHPGPPWQ